MNYWADNALCVPTTSKVHLIWSNCGSISGMKCVNVAEPGGPDYAKDNYLCWEE
ncbi:unnamed protein product, partial [Rotaria sp. Silwood2]